MKNAGVNILFESDIAVVGISEIAKHIFEIKRVFKGLVKSLEEYKFDLVILVDFPGFNLKFSSEVNKRNIPLIYYISPQVWAWGKNRIKVIKRNVDKIIVFFKFEEELYKKYGINAEFVGHPLIDVVKPNTTRIEWRKTNNLPLDKTLISLLPGSRTRVIEHLLPLMLKSAELIKKELPNTEFLVLKFPDINRELYDKFINNSSLNIKIVEGDLFNALNASDFSIGASGTSSLETAIIGTPMVITYKFSNLSFLLIRIAARINFIGLPNIIANKLIVKEFLQLNATPRKISKEVISTLKDPQKISTIKNDLEKVRLSLGEPGASVKAAKAIQAFLNKK